MASVEVTFYTGVPHDNVGTIPIPGLEIGTYDVTYNVLTPGELAIPPNATIAVFTPSTPSRIKIAVGANSSVPSKTAPKNRLFGAGLLTYIGVPGSGRLGIIQES